MVHMPTQAERQGNEGQQTEDPHRVVGEQTMPLWV